MSKADRKREDLSEHLLSHVLAHGLSGQGVRELAAACGLSDRMLLYYFADKQAVLAGICAAFEARIDDVLKDIEPPRSLPFDTLRRHLWAVFSQADTHALLVFWGELALLSARGNNVAKMSAEKAARRMLLWIASQLDSRQKGAESVELLAGLLGVAGLRSAGLNGLVSEL